VGRIGNSSWSLVRKEVGMVRFKPVCAVGLLFLGLAAWPAPLHADPQENAIGNALAIQRAMEQAKYFLHTGENQKAVLVLEEQVSRINGNPEFLRLMREAYRGYVKDLLASAENQLAEKYRKRLSIIDTAAANDPSLRPGAGSAKKSAPAVPASLAGQAGPASQADKNDRVAAMPPPATARGKIEDPFDLVYQRPAAGGDDKQKLAQTPLAQTQLAQTLLAQAHTEFAQRRFAQARLYFEQAAQMDPAAVAQSRDCWGYCKLKYVIDQLNQTSLDKSTLPELQREVNSAVSMAPALAEKGKLVLASIDERRRSPAATGAGNNAAETPSDRNYTIQHHDGSGYGWQLAETTHFRIYHKQSRDYAEKVALVAERTRYEMYRKWFGNGGPDWMPKCDLYLHPTAQDYARDGHGSPSSPGHSKIDHDRETGRVAFRRMDMRCDNPNMLEAVLPHETTHVVLAGQFGPVFVPRWCDEGIAVLTEPTQEIEKHRRNLARCQRDGLLFTVKDLMTMKDYPHPRQIGAFYAQSVVLCDYLTKLRGPQTLTAFIRDAMREGYDASLRRHYGWDFATLETQWNQHVTAEISRLSAVAGR
jgi:tetratricopeptide (TPR) repeat protein